MHDEAFSRLETTTCVLARKSCSKFGFGNSYNHEVKEKFKTFFNRAQKYFQCQASCEAECQYGWLLGKHTMAGCFEMCLKISRYKFQILLRPGPCEEAHAPCGFLRKATLVRNNVVWCMLQPLHGLYRQLFSNFPESSLQGRFEVKRKINFQVWHFWSCPCG